LNQPDSNRWLKSQIEGFPPPAPGAADKTDAEEDVLP
jgi:hypothetical protein